MSMTEKPQTYQCLTYLVVSTMLLLRRNEMHLNKQRIL